MRKIVAISVLVVLLSITGADADIVELPLGAEGRYDVDSGSWEMDFDLGVTFAEISNVYIDWSGTITAELVGIIGFPDRGGPLDAQFVAILYELDPHNYFARAEVQGGVATYPDPDPFALQSAFTNEGWSTFLDGRGSVSIQVVQLARPAVAYTIEYPSGQLDSATLVFEGTLVPEPMSILLLTLGIVIVRVNLILSIDSKKGKKNVCS